MLPDAGFRLLLEERSVLIQRARGSAAMLIKWTWEQQQRLPLKHWAPHYKSVLFNGEKMCIIPLKRLYHAFLTLDDYHLLILLLFKQLYMPVISK